MLLTLATGYGQDGCCLSDLLEALEWPVEPSQAKPKRAPILYLADRNVLVDDPKDKTFAPFGDARWHKIERRRRATRAGRCISPRIRRSRDERHAGLYREFPPDFFDLVIVDECHRAAHAMRATGARSSNTSGRPFNSA